MPSINPLELYLELTAIPGTSGEEHDIAQAIVGHLKNAGLPDEQMRFDDANTRTRRTGNTGNLIVHLPGKGAMADGPVTLLSAHMDTVPICVGCEPKVDGDYVVSANPETGLGADDRSGCTVLLQAALHLLQTDQDHPPAIFAWLIQEEIGLEGARHIDPSVIGRVDQAFNYDGGSIDRLTIGAIGGERIEIEVFGIPAHAGVAPQEGASAIQIASLAIAELHQSGWLGQIDKSGEPGGGVGTANVGVIQGGEATNVVTPHVRLKAEARSHDAAFRTAIVARMRQAFESAAASVQTDSGTPGRVQFDSHVDYESFRLPDDHPSIDVARRLTQQAGGEGTLYIANGGLDANWLFQHGISAITMGCGQMNIHTANEKLDIKALETACDIARKIIMGAN
ncbi:MAG: M20/M25/M40 family metallo-hydrolase [Planctomycetota bacterium]